MCVGCLFFKDTEPSPLHVTFSVVSVSPVVSVVSVVSVSPVVSGVTVVSPLFQLFQCHGFSSFSVPLQHPVPSKTDISLRNAGKLA